MGVCDGLTEETEALGGECLEDFARLREDAGLGEMLGHELPSPEAGWRPYREDPEVIRECAELPWDPAERKAGEALDEVRYLAIRVRWRQGVLFEDGTLTKHFAVVANRFDFDARRLLEWHREKAGSIEALHDVLKNALAAGMMPCARFGANAAWLRLAVMTHNVLTGLKRIALKPEYLRARPKRLRFQIFCSPGTLVHHARQLRVRVGRLLEQLRAWAEAWLLLPSADEAPHPMREAADHLSTLLWHSALSGPAASTGSPTLVERTISTSGLSSATRSASAWSFNPGSENTSHPSSASPSSPDCSNLSATSTRMATSPVVPIRTSVRCGSRGTEWRRWS
jgi:hypothetical protein